MANGFTAWGGIFCLDGRWYAVGGAKERAPASCWASASAPSASRGRRLAEHQRDRRERLQDQGAGCASRRPRSSSPTCRPSAGMDYGLTRYRASALLTFKFNQRAIRDLHRGSRGRRVAAAA